MARRFQEITEVYRQEIAALARADRWAAFLRSACRNYKLPFEEQVLVHAQRPDATAVLEIERWNRQFGRWVNKGATGIAVFDRDYPGRTRLKYYFDISDTHESRLSRPVPLWQVPTEQEPDVIEALENRFGALDDKGTLEEAIVSAMENAAADNMTDYLDDLQNCRDNSLLEELDELNLSVLYRRLLENSTAYMLMCRCGLEPDEYFDPEDFSEVFNFNTPETLNALGVATRDIAESGLSAIALTVRSRQKQIRTIAQAPGNEYPIDKQTETQTERSENHGTDIHDEGRLPAAGSAAAAGAGNSPWEIRPATPEVSEGAPEGAVHEPADIGQAERASGGDRPDGAAARGTDGDGDGSGRGRDGGAESRRPDEVGGADEQPEKRRRGDSAGGADLQLNTEPEEADSAEEATSELPAFLDEKKIFAIIENRNDDLIYKKAQIELFFLSHPDEAERAEYLRSAYQDRFTEILADGARLGYRPQKNGLLMWEGAYLSRTSESVFSWKLVAGFTAQLIDKREYYVNTEIKPFVPMESQQLTLFDMPAFDQPEDTPVAPLSSHPKLPQQIMDEALCVGANDEHSRLIICAYFMKDKPDNAAFLQKHYGENGAGFYFGGEKVSLWYDAEGMRIARGSTAQRSSATLISWEEAAKRIRELLELGRYMPQSELDEVDHYERMRLADSIAYTSRDMTTEARNAGFLPLAMLAQSVKGGYPETQKQIYELLCAPDTLQKCVDEWTAFNAALDAGQDLLRFRFYRPKEILERLRDLQREPLHFTVADGFAPDRQFFISADEIDKVLRGWDGSTDYRLGVYAFYATHKDKTEREKYLKDYHGEYSGHSGGNDNLTHTRGKGIEFSHGSITAPYAKVTLKWPEAAKRIGELISQNKFLSDADWAAMPEYERKQLARKIVNFFMDTPDDVVRPFSQNAIADYWECVKAVTVQLSDADRVQEIYQNMLPAWEATKEEDRHYTLRKQGIEAMRAYLDGTYSVFGLGKTLQTPTTEAVSERPAAEPEVSEPEPPIAEAETSEIEPALPAEEKAVLTAPQPKRERMRFAPLYPEIPTGQRHDFHITDRELGVGSKAEKYASNVAAIRTLQAVESENRLATPEEQETLSCYVGWGGLADAFDPDKESWSKEYAQLKELLTPEEYAAARASTLNAHYTSPTVIRAIYEAVGRMGFETGNILEPSCGVGNFFGMLPEEMRNSRLYGVELDPVSGRIAKQLYPKADITVGGFETTDRRDFFDLAIGNVPFGQYQVNDKAYNKLNFSIHNYFFAKALDQVRSGGVVAFVTSRYTMDAKDSTVRRYLAQRAELLGAIRLPNDAFKKNAGAEVVSDIIFLQKRDRPLDIVPEWTQTGQTEDGFAINRYFIDHPEMVLGRQEPVSTAHGMDYTVNPIEGLELSDQLHDAVKYIHGTYQEAELPELGEGEAIDTSIPADPNVKNYSYAIVDGQVYYRENSRMVRPDLNATAEARVKGLVGLRDCVQELIDLQMDAAVPDSTITQKQAELNSLYDSFSAKYGLINDRANRLAYADDSSYYLLCALEVIDEDGKLERKADMFTKRTIKPHQAVAVVDTASEALAVSISEKACVDMDYMSQLTGKTKEALAGELQGVIFRVPGQLEQDGTPHYVTADEYLSGNVRRKLRQAQRAALQNLSFAVNVEALTAAQPKDLDASEIEVRLGATWIDKEYIQQFMYETFNTPFYLQRSIEVNYSSFTAEWQIKGKSSVSYNDVAAYTTYGTSRANAYKILEDSLNLRDVRIYDTIEDADGKERRVLNAKETTLAAQKQQAIREAFRDWIWRDPERRQTLVRQYNEEMNSTRPREYDGSHITFGGMNPAITLREHQKSAIAHVLYGGNTLLAHEVGAGKTFEMVAASMEAKRLGLCQKSLFVVPNHLTEQWASEFLRLYPSANILVTTKKDFETHNRKKFCARIATGDYDAIIMGHSQFERIPISRERQERLLYEQIDEITEGIAEVQASGGERFTVKQLERTRKSLEARLEKLQAEGRKDDVVTFEQLGVDRLFVDEAHNYKNLFLYTKMRNVAGLSTSDAQKSSDMFAKCRYMDEITGNRGVIFATGTPVSNSMTELYTMQRYLQYERLQELNMTHFDCWASRFGETVTALELAPEGTGYRARTRFSKFFNLPELMNLFKEVADIKTADQLNLPTPEVEYHNIVAQPTEHQQEMVKALSERASLVHSGTVDPSQDNMLKITSDGRKLGLDQRIVNQMLPDEPGTKVNQCVDNIMQIWRDGKADKLTQLVFCDISTPQAKAPVSKAAKTLDNPLLHALEGAVPLPEQEPVFTVYDDIRQKLIAQGMPADQIAFIHEANTEVRKKELFSKVRTGQVRVLLGSTAKMGAGTNVQDRLVALHDLDCPWRPGDLAQRKGRIERQGNQNPLVHVYRYVTEGTFDAYLWQTVENKQKFISQIMTSKSPVRSCDDVDETALSFAEIKALCAGDPRIKERMDLDVEVSRLKLMKADHQSKQYRLEDQLLKYFPEEIEKHKGFIKGFESDLEVLAAHPHPEDDFAGMEIRGDLLTDKENAGAALLDACKEVKTSDPVQIGSYRGYAISVEFSAWKQEYTLLLKGQMTHRATLGTDPRGNLTRIDNALAQMPQRLEAAKAQLDNLYQQQAAAKEEVGKPFLYEEELRSKNARLVELDTLLNIDGKGQAYAEAVVTKSTRTSVLDSLKRPVTLRSTDKKPKQHEEVR